MRPRAAVIGFALALVLGLPGAGSAGVLDIIWAMSGPRMVGAGAYCRWTLDWELKDCRLEGFADQIRANNKQQQPWFTVEASGYFSVPYHDYGWFDAFMVMVEPSIEVPWPIKSSKWLVYSGAGFTFDGLAGKSFYVFGNSGMKFRPIAIERNRWAIAYNLRLYPDEFGQDRFNRAPAWPTDQDRPHEVIHSLSVAIPLGKHF